MICERCGAPITETHICVPRAAYLERRILKLENRVEELEELLEMLVGKKTSRKPPQGPSGSGER